MKAITQDRYGSADVLRMSDIDRPAIGDDEVLVQVRAVGLDLGAIHLMTGLPYLVRLFLGLRRPRDPVRGREVAGLVEAVGKNVTDLEVGEEVFGVGEGCLAEYTRAKAKKLVAKPANVSFEQAAASVISATTALQGLRDVGKVQPGQKVLVIGAGGGVGTFAVQLAKMFGAEVTGVCSTAKADLVRSLGADAVIDYTREEIVDGKRHFDLILDIAGNRRLSYTRRALTPRGTLVLCGGEEGGPWLGGMERAMGATLMSPFVGQKLRMLMATERKQDLRELSGLLEAGTIAPVIGKTYPLTQAVDAMRHLSQGHAQGKLVVTL